MCEVCSDDQRDDGQLEQLVCLHRVGGWLTSHLELQSGVRLEGV